MIRALCTALALAPLAAAAQDEPLALSYDVFEVAVPHVDLDACPETMATDGVFCRATLNMDEIHVFAFREDGDSPLVAVEHFPADGLPGLLD